MDAAAIQRLARPEILAMKPYASARGTAGDDGVLLNANEAPVSLVEVEGGSLALNRYPPPQPEALASRLARLYGVDISRVLVTRGSDEGIDLLLRVFCRPGEDAILECPPCFGMYRISAQVQGAEVVAVERDPGSLAMDVSATEQALREDGRIRLVFLTSPNNPTGDLLARDDLLRLLEACDEQALLVLDEAYIEFCSAESAADLVAQHPQLVVLRTLSKAWASAGLRCGAVIADPAVINLLGRVMAPYPLSAPAIDAALTVTSQGCRERQADMLAELAEEKLRLLTFLDSLPGIRDTWPGEANFVLIRVDDGTALVRHCAGAGVRIRDFSNQRLLSGCVRLTVGNRADMEQLEAALADWSTKQ